MLPLPPDPQRWGGAGGGGYCRPSQYRPDDGGAAVDIGRRTRLYGRVTWQLHHLFDFTMVARLVGLAALALYESAVECGAARSGAERRRRAVLRRERGLQFPVVTGSLIDAHVVICDDLRRLPRRPRRLNAKRLPTKPRERLLTKLRDDY